MQEAVHDYFNSEKKSESLYKI